MKIDRIDYNLQKGNFISLGNRYAKILEIYHTMCVCVDIEETQDTIEDIERVSGIELSENILNQIENMRMIDSKTFKYGHYDSNYVLTRDWNVEPSYHIGIEYTDSGDPRDDGQIYNFGHDIKYLHQLQNILKGVNNIDIKVNI